MNKFQDDAVRANAIAEVLLSIELSEKEREELQLLYENPQGFAYEVDVRNRPQGPTIATCRNVGSRIKRALGTNYSYGMNWVGTGDSAQALWRMNDSFRAAAEAVGLFEAADVDALERYQLDFSNQVERSLADSADALRERLAKADRKPQRQLVTTYVFKRNPDVVAAALLRAKGMCEGCGKEAPFITKKENRPYLEVHHRTQLAHGGEDSLENVIALCPNCHRQSHYG